MEDKMQEEYKIEKNIPVPIQGESSKYRIAKDMSVGDSLILPDRRTSYSFVLTGKKLVPGSKWATRKTGNGDQIRVWRSK